MEREVNNTYNNHTIKELMNSDSANSSEINSCILIAESVSSDYHHDAKFADFNSANVLDFNLNWLVDNKLKECFVLYSKSKKQVEEYFAEGRTKSNLKIHLVYVNEDECKTLGDFLREVNFRQLVTKDFLLVFADLITNVNLRPAIEQYESRRQHSKINILSALLTKGSSSECFIIDKTSRQILQIHDLNRKFELNTQRIQLKKHSQSIVIRADLVPSSIYLCSIDVLKGFKETFQFHTMNDFINGMLTSEIYEEKIHCYILKNNEVAVRTNTALGLYDAYVSLISRYLYPYTIPTGGGPLRPSKGGNAAQQQQTFVKYLDYNKYIKTQKALPNVKLSHNVYIGENASIGPGSSIFKTVVGLNARIGSNSVLKYCLVLNDTSVPQNSKYQYCLLEMVNGELNAVSFKKEVLRQVSLLEDNELFPGTPESKENFLQELKVLISETPTEQTFEEFTSLRKMFNKEPQEFVVETLVLLEPKKVPEMQKVVKEWGSLLKRTCLNQSSMLISSFMECCRRVAQIKSAFHIFVQFMYMYKILTEQSIISWHKDNILIEDNKYFAELCTRFVGKLVETLQAEEDEDQEDDEDDDEDNQ